MPDKFARPVKTWGLHDLSKKQRKLFNEYWKANKKIFKGKKKADIIPIWKDGYVCGRYSDGWKVK